MNAVLNAPQNWPPWEEEMVAIRAEVRREMEQLVTEDETPVDNILSEKQQRLLTEPLYGAWAGPEHYAPGHRPFLALANVGLFYALREPPLVPDMMLALDVVGLGADLSEKANRSYFVWEQGKPPVVAIEIVSNREGGEDSEKFQKYVAAAVGYYVIFDPWRRLSERVLRIYQLAGQAYVEQVGSQFNEVGLGVTLWQGEYEGEHQQWLRWVDRTGRLIPTGAERAESAEQRAESAEQRAESAEQRAERLAAQLRALGIDPAA
jgi:Uma2 family endonuclease